MGYSTEPIRQFEGTPAAYASSTEAISVREYDNFADRGTAILIFCIQLRLPVCQFMTLAQNNYHRRMFVNQLIQQIHVQWNLRIKDTLGAELLSSGGRFIQIAIYSHIKNVWCVCMVCIYPISSSRS